MNLENSAASFFESDPERFCSVKKYLKRVGNLSQVQIEEYAWD